MRPYLILAVILASLRADPVSIRADDPAPKRVALLVGVNKYQKPGFSDLEFAEADVVAVEAELKKLGFEVTTLLGSGEGRKQATLANIETAALEMVKPLNKRDVALVMLSGHGQQLNPDPNADPSQVEFQKLQSYYCPVDALVNRPESQFSLTHLLDDVLAPNVGTKLLLVDACRDVPIDRSRGSRNAKGIEGRIIALPEETGVFFSCRAGQMSFERHELRHGLFTHCVLEALQGKAQRNGEITWADLVAHVSFQMAQPELVEYMPANLRQVPIPAGAVPHTVLGKVEVQPSSPPLPTPRPTPPGGAPPSVAKVEGSRAGEAKILDELKLTLGWCPPGRFTMGSPADEPDRGPDEEQVPVTISRGYWLGQTEVTQRQWEAVMGTKPWVQHGDPAFYRAGADYPAVYVSHGLNSDGVVELDSATEFCRRLTQRERAAGNLPADWELRLPSEAEWEYGCRANKQTPYCCDGGAAALSDFAWFDENAWDRNERYAHFVAQKSPNAWGLYDVHGNVWEWCQDSYQERRTGGKDPHVNAATTARVFRGGSWNISAWLCRSAVRGQGESNHRNFNVGFRVAMCPVSK